MPYVISYCVTYFFSRRSTIFAPTYSIKLGQSNQYASLIICTCCRKFYLSKISILSYWFYQKLINTFNVWLLISISICSTLQIHSQIQKLLFRNLTKPCWLCDNKGIYQCPACDTISCSLKCCLKHKEVAQCTGDWRDADIDYEDPYQLHRDLNQLVQIENKNNDIVFSANSLTNPRKKVCSISGQQEGYLDILAQQQSLPKHIKNLQKQLQKIYQVKLLLSKNITATNELYTYLSNYDYNDKHFTLQCKIYQIDYKKQLYNNAVMYLQRYLEFLNKKGIYNVKQCKQQPFDIVFTIFLSDSKTIFIQDEEVITKKVFDDLNVHQEQTEVLLKLDYADNYYFHVEADQKLSDILKQRLVVVDHLKFLIVTNKMVPGDILVNNNDNQLTNKFEKQQIDYIWKKIVNFLNIKYTAQIKTQNHAPEQWKDFQTQDKLFSKKVFL